MATAPRPGSTSDSKRARTTITIGVRDRDPETGEVRREWPSVSLCPNNISIHERLVVRKATGLPVDAFLGSEERFGLDSVQVIWWLARRASGEPFLTLNKVEQEWPDELDINEDLDLELDDGLDDEADEVDEDSPEYVEQIAELVDKAAHPEG